MVKRFLITLAAMSIGFANTANSAIGTTTCAPLKEALENLSAMWGEEPIAAGSALTVRVLRVENPQTGSFTVLAINKDGVACLIDMGMERKS